MHYNEIFELMKKNNIEVINSLQDTLKANIDEHSQLVTKTTTSMDTTMKSLQSEFDNAKKALDSDVSVALDEASKNYSTQTKKVEEEINNLIEQDIISELNVSSEKSSLLDKAIADTKDELQEVNNTYPSWIKTDTDNFTSNLGNVITEFQESIQQELDALYSSVQKDLQKTYERMASDFVSNVTEIKNEFDKEKKDYELNISHQINSFVTNSDSNSSALVTNIQGTKDTLTEAITTGNTAVNTDLNNLENTLNDLFDSYLESFSGD